MTRTPLRSDRRRALYASTAWLIGPMLSMNSALARVLVDAADPAIARLAEELVRGHDTPCARAVAIHDHVRDAIRFGFTPNFYAMSAADVLAARVGFANSKATLFIALLRAAGIEARQQFVDVDAALLHGVLDLHTPFVDHSYTEVLLGGAWVATDSYVVDRTLFRAARSAVRAEGRRLGYGVQAEGSCAWNGREPSFAQYPQQERGLSRRRWGVFPDVATFYDSTPGAWNRRTDVLRVVFPLAALSANRAAEALRAHGPSAVRNGKLRARA